jgi:hypothetical protein
MDILLILMNVLPQIAAGRTTLRATRRRHHPARRRSTLRTAGRRPAHWSTLRSALILRECRRR